MDITEIYRADITEHGKVLEQTAEALAPAFVELVRVCARAVADGRKIIFLGNGGSAADAQHLAAELVVRFRRDRPAIPALALTTDSSILTAGGNDLGFDEIFARQVEALGRPGDVLVALSTSGRSPNVLRAVSAARAMGLSTVALTGAGGGDLAGLADLVLAVPSHTTARIQEMHILIGHMLCAGIETSLGFAQ
jgi:D-sedoheptulose 7-phosphate isomerase